MPTIKKWMTLVKKKKMNRNIFIGLVLILVGIAGMFTLIPGKKFKESDIIDTKHNIHVRFNGRDNDIPKDGQLLIIKCSLEDTIVVEPASLDDCRRILEENGRG